MFSPTSVIVHELRHYLQDVGHFEGSVIDAETEAWVESKALIIDQKGKEWADAYMKTGLKDAQ